MKGKGEFGARGAVLDLEFEEFQFIFELEFKFEEGPELL